jgi:hypothetical protein
MISNEYEKHQCAIQWWEKHESMFPTIGFFAHHILSIVIID